MPHWRLLNGDTIISTPLVRYLHNQGNEVYYLASDSGMPILQNNPHVTKLIHHKTDSIANDKLGEYFDSLAKAYECDSLIDLCESIECSLCFHPVQPQYNYTKNERKLLGNKNYYQQCFVKAGYPIPEKHEDLRPEVFFTDKEEEDFLRFREQYIGKKIILWALSGSSLHKSYPFTFLVMSKILVDHPDVIFVTIGDEKCKILEQGLQHERVIHKSGKWSFRQSMMAIKYASLLIAPDTGILHASGCFKTPKIGMQTAVTIECVSKYFLNDFSVEAKIHCAPCFRLIYDSRVQCNIDPTINAPFCAAYGLDPELIIERIEYVFKQFYSNKMPSL